MMDETCLLCTCLHDGPIPVEETREPETRATCAEEVNSVPAGTVARSLGAVCRAYGACGVVAIDGDAVIGKVRFYPATVTHLLPDHCVLSDERFRQCGFEAALSTDRCEHAWVQRGDPHPAMKKLWEPHAYLSDEEAARTYDVVLHLRKTG